jgi:hypothetical protein
MIVATLFYLFLGGLLLLVYRVLSARSVEVERVMIERIAAFVAGVDGDVVAIGRGVTRKDLVRSLAFVAEMTTEQASDRVRIIMKYYHLESYMLRRIFASRHDSQRAYLLALMSRLPISMLAALRVEPLVYAKSTEVGFYALAAIFAVTPLRGVATLARMSHRLSRRDVAELLSVVNRGCCPVPYTPLLLSENYNLQLLGLYLVRRFAIAESRREIATIVKNRSSELRDDALSVLASFGEVMIEYEGGKCRIV